MINPIPQTPEDFKSITCETLATSIKKFRLKQQYRIDRAAFIGQKLVKKGVIFV
jgi:hypothetical protein